MTFRLWHATLTGGFFGLSFGVALEAARQVRFNYAIARMVEDFESRGMSPPLIIDLQRPHVIPIFSCMLFAALSSLVYVIWSQRK